MEKTKNDMTLVVIGAGPAGLAATYFAQQAGYKVILLEKSDVPGGKGGSRKWKDFVVDFGPHAYHPMSHGITEFVEAHGGGKLIDVSIVQKLYITLEPMRYPLHVFEALTKFGFLLNLQIFMGYLWVRLKGLFFKLPQNSFRQWGIAHFGKKFYELCFGAYSRRVWKHSDDGLALEFARRKLPNLSLGAILCELLTHRKRNQKNDKSYLNIKKFIYHKEGFGNVYRNIAESIIQKGGQIIYGADIKRINLSDQNKVTDVVLCGPREECVPCDYLVSTAPLDDLVSYFEPKKEEWGNYLKGIRFKNGLIVNVVVNKKNILDCHWIYLVHPRFLFNRISEPKHFSPSLGPADKTLIMFETICGFEDEKWQWSPEEWRPWVEQDLSFFGVQLKEIEDIFLSKMEKAFPFYLTGYEPQKKGLLSELAKLKNFVTTGRYGLYMDINMHDAMLLGQESIDYLLKGKQALFYHEHEAIPLRKRKVSEEVPVVSNEMRNINAVPSM